MPGSLKLALNSIPITKMKRTPPTAGMAGVRLDARKGQLRKHGEKHENKCEFFGTLREAFLSLLRFLASRTETVLNHISGVF